MGQKMKKKDKKNHIPRVKASRNEKACHFEDFLKDQKKKPKMPLDDLKDSTVLKERRQKKRAAKREKQSRKDKSKEIEATLEKNIDRLEHI